MLNLFLAFVQIVIASLIIIFWISFYLTEYKNQKMSDVEFKHEKSFPLPDLGWVTPNLIIAAIGLILEQRYGFFFTITAGSGMMFLGLIDLAFDLQNDKFKGKNADAYMSIFFVVSLLIFGPIFIIYGWVNF